MGICAYMREWCLHIWHVRGSIILHVAINSQSSSARRQEAHTGLSAQSPSARSLCMRAGRPRSQALGRRARRPRSQVPGAQFGLHSAGSGRLVRHNRREQWSTYLRNAVILKDHYFGHHVGRTIPMSAQPCPIGSTSMRTAINSLLAHQEGHTRRCTMGAERVPKLGASIIVAGNPKAHYGRGKSARHVVDRVSVGVFPGSMANRLPA